MYKSFHNGAATYFSIISGSALFQGLQHQPIFINFTEHMNLKQHIVHLSRHWIDIDIGISSDIYEYKGEIRKPSSVINAKKNRENNRMGETRDLFKKIRDTKGTFHEKMGTIKDRNGMDLTEAEAIKKRWQEYTELYKKDLLIQMIMMV